MPTFDFKCKKCGYFFEELVLSDREKVRCPKCKSSEVEKIITGFNIGGDTRENTGNTSCPLCRINPPR